MGPNLPALLFTLYKKSYMRLRTAVGASERDERDTKHAKLKGRSLTLLFSYNKISTPCAYDRHSL